MPHKQNRNSTQVELEILNQCRLRPIKSKIAQNTNLSNDQVTRRLESLIKRGHVVAVLETERRRGMFSEFDEQRVRYAITESGEKRRKALEAVFGEQDNDPFKKSQRS
ncbi:MAG TPA: winged helix-turn-helix domain-containing protein [Candidatus Aquilonibacter sp.]|nr:winged helix-turn-helix domain-containing protein [Candidatus Aquilonibacter sp.]